MKRTERFRNQRGTHLIELALVMPILLLLALGIIDVAGLIHANQVVSNAAREGARLSVAEEQQGYTGDGPNTIVQRVQDYIVTENDINCTSEPAVTINQDAFTPTAGGYSLSSSEVTVVCPYQMQFLPALTGGQVPATVNVMGRVRFRNFY